MGQVLHGSAKTKEAVRRAIQNSQESLRTLSKRYRINPKCCQMEEAKLGDRPANWPQGAPINRSVVGG